MAEQQRQNNTIELIASENFVSPEILAAVGSCLTNKYAEGRPYKRYYGGCYYVDALETYCTEQWQQVFNTDYKANVQPHSGSQANFAAYMSLVNPGDTILAMELNNGGHLTHGSNVNFSGKLYHFVFYGVNSDGFIDMEDVERQVVEHKPKLIVAGASAYSRIINFEQFSDIAKKYGIPFMVDMAHIAGLIAAGEHPSPFGLADVITTTTHKTLRGPRGGIIFCKPELQSKVNSAVFPGTQGGPLEHVIAGKAICAEEAQTEQYREYIRQVVRNSKAMAQEFINLGYKVVTGGTDNHLFLVDLTSLGISGLQVQEALDKLNITLNKNCVPGETRSPNEASGIRIGTAAMTTKGYKELDFINVARVIDNEIKRMRAPV